MNAKHAGPGSHADSEPNDADSTLPVIPAGVVVSVRDSSPHTRADPPDGQGSDRAPNSELFFAALARGILGCPYCGSIGGALRTAPGAFGWHEYGGVEHLCATVWCIAENRQFDVIFRPRHAVIGVCRSCESTRFRVELDTVTGKVPYRVGATLSCASCGIRIARQVFEAFAVRDSDE